MRLLFAIVMIANMLFAADAAYAMGGGGHGGDGRRDSSQPANTVRQGVNYAVPQDVNDQEGNSGKPNSQSVSTASVPEPITVLLLGIGICLATGFIVTKRKLKS